MPESFNDQYARSYERHSARLIRPYQTAIDALLIVDGGIRPNESVVDIGSGTLNSTIYLARSAPLAQRIVGLEPSGMIRLANYKLGRGPNPFSDPQLGFESAVEYIEEQKKHGEKLSSKIDLVQGRVPEIPFGSGTFDRAYMCQVIHWLAFPDESSPADFDYLARGLRGVADILKPNGKLLFDSNGHIFNYEGLPDGEAVNKRHYVNHPLYQAFDNNFNEFVTKEGYKIEETEEKTPDRLRFLFNIDKIQGVLSTSGFELVNGLNGNNHLITYMEFPARRIAASILDTARMHHFRHKGLNELPDQERDRIVSDVMDITLKTIPDDDMQYRETFISFAAQRAA